MEKRRRRSWGAERRDYFVQLIDGSLPITRLPHFALLAQINKRSALAAFVLRSFGEVGDVGVALQILAHAAAQDAGAVSVDDAHAGQTGEEGTVNVLRQFLSRFVDGAADEVDFSAHVIYVGADDRDVHALLAARGGEGIGSFDGTGIRS